MFEAPPDAATGDYVDRPISANLQGVRVLLADDGETNRKLIGLFLTRSGASVEMAENGALALHAAEQATFDVILMDMQMPVMDGYTATVRLREKGFTGPIIALTAHAMKGDREKCESAGCSGYLAKPVNMDELVRTVKSAAIQTSISQTATSPAETDQGAISMPSSSQTFRSTLPTDDPEIREVVVEFLESIGTRLDAMSAALATDDFDELARLAHALKGSGGTAGYNCFTEPAARIESLAKSRQGSDIEGAFDEIRQLQDCVAV
jgi:CheY-like chemotaxis protein